MVSGLPAFPMLDDTAVPNSDIAFDNSPMINDQGVGDHQIQRGTRAAASGAAILTHTIANDFAAAESDFFAVLGEVALDFNYQLGVGEANPIADGWAVQVGVGPSTDLDAHSLPLISPRCPKTWRLPPIATRRTSLQLAGFKAGAGSGRDIQAHAARLLTMEFQSWVRFVEVVMAANLNGAITGVTNLQFDCGSVRVPDDGIVSEEVFAGNHD